MLIEFSVTNFRSFRERQTLQMTASSRLGKKENAFSPEVSGEKLPNLLKAVAIYGGNASGKTSFIKALGVVEKLARRKPEASSEDLPVWPFRFDKELLDKPSTFELHFISGEMRYQFRVSVTQKRVVEETLFVYPRGRESLIYSRSFNGDAEKYAFGDIFEGDIALRDVWRKLTGPKTLFISQAVANSSEELTQLRIPFDWLVNGFFVLDDGPMQLRFLGERRPKYKGWAEDVCKFLQQVDVPVTEIRWEDDSSSRAVDDKGDDASAASEENIGKKTTFVHETRLGSAEFDIFEESSGTRNLVGFWLPWFFVSGASGDFPGKCRVLIIDELDASLHPEVVAHLLQMQIESGVKAQIIFTTHDTHLMSAGLLRRDQFWLTDRDVNGASRLRSIHSFRGREGEDVEKRYFEGRYRGLPILRRG